MPRGCFYCRTRILKRNLQPSFSNLCKDCYIEKKEDLERSLERIRFEQEQKQFFSQFEKIEVKINIKEP